MNANININKMKIFLKSFMLLRGLVTYTFRPFDLITTLTYVLTFNYCSCFVYIFISSLWSNYFSYSIFYFFKFWLAYSFNRKASYLASYIIRRNIYRSTVRLCSVICRFSIIRMKNFQLIWIKKISINQKQALVCSSL